MWQWKDEHQNWNPYNAGSTLTLESAKSQASDSVSIEALGRSYTVDLGSMEQTNDSTNVARSVERMKVGGLLLKKKSWIILARHFFQEINKNMKFS